MATAVSAEAAVAASFSELNAALKRENYSRAVDICNKIRSKFPDDVDAVKVKCVALIRLEKFDKALELAVKYEFLSTEKAYCLYRLKQDDDALKLLEGGDLEAQSTAQLHLAAQLHFRKGNYDQSTRIYELLLSRGQEVGGVCISSSIGSTLTTPAGNPYTIQGDDLLELRTNLLAAYASAGRSHELKDREIPIDDGFEVAFNKSFVAIQSGDWEAAEELLLTAERLCRDTFVAEGASEAEIEDEVAVIKTQLAFVKQMRGDLDGALSDYRNVLKLKLRNRAVGAVASNNIVTIRKDRDVLDSFKRLKNIDASVLSDKLNPAQQEAILTNRALLLCLMNKTEECRESLEALKKQFPLSKSIADIVVLLAIKDQSAAGAIEQLQGDVSVGGRLGLAHVYLTEGQVLKAAECIRSIEQLAHSPADDSASAQAVLESALTHHKAGDYTSEQATKIREGDCWYKIQKKQYREAADAYLELLEGQTAGALDRDLRLRSMASLVVALSFCDAEAAEARCAMLPAVEESGVDPSELEKQVPRSTRLAAKFADTGDKKSERKRAAKSPEAIARKRAKRREAHLANLRARPDYNASIGLVNPDPERWIPRKQRSHGKRGRRGRNRFVGAQGAGMGTEKDALKLDAAARAARKAESDKPAAVVVSSGSGIRKSKKKKRR
ncbi:putative TPR-like repeat [Phytophthora cactorum]|nr:putative TPR-like repeat [Phytophthora cactorum]